MNPDPTPCPLDHLTLRGAAGDVALVAGDESLTYAALDQAVGRTAAAFRAHGLAPGDRIASWMGKTRFACIAPLAAARAGLVHVPINPLLKRAQAVHILADSGAKLLVANQARLATLDPGAFAAVALEDWRDGDEALPPSRHDPDTLAALLYTSGSTGRPKGVMLSHANLWLGAVSVAHFLRLTPADRTLALLPLAFDYGQNQLLSAWAAGGTAIAFDYLLAADVRKAVRRHDVTVLAGVPPLWQQLAQLDWSGGEGASLATLTNSGGHLPEPLVRRLRALFPNAALHLMYGLTEAFRASSLDPALVDAHPDSVGTAIPFAELAVIRPDGTSAALGEEGELVQSGPLVAHGYWNDPARTAERFRDGKVYSGDTMIIGDDGLLHFRGRDDAMIKVSGNRLSPTEIEELALASGAVSDAAAFGVADAALGQAVVLVAVPLGKEAEQRLLAHFTANAPAYMKPQRIVWRDALPTGATGKLDRVALKESLA
ncbi:MAG: AMP-binding protein [Sphingomicrobium sp.]